jgi:LuxR family transcriptional regulator, maltose regulon positive regulatory protein
LPDRILRRLVPAGAPAVEGPEGPCQDALVEPLSSRELEVLRLIEQGLSNQEIADRLTVAASTVKTHINNIYGKLGVQTRVQAVKRSNELNLLGAARAEISSKN